MIMVEVVSQEEARAEKQEERTERRRNFRRQVFFHSLFLIFLFIATIIILYYHEYYYKKNNDRIQQQSPSWFGNNEDYFSSLSRRDDEYCHDLATKLSNNYRNTSPYENDSDKNISLNSYLSRHGLLVSMCMPFYCSLGFDANHIAASWINMDIGSSHIIPTDSQVGLILNPLHIGNIDCLYPTDGASDSRDDNGCGPMQYDPQYGSKGANSMNYFSKRAFRSYLDRSMNMNFGKHTPASDIPCDQLFQLIPPMNKLLYWTYGDNNNNNATIQYQSQGSFTQDQVEAIMDRPICNSSITPDGYEGNFLVLVSGQKEGYSASMWQSVIDLQMNFIESNNKEKIVLSPIWNEIIIDLPQQPQLSLDDLILGVFYINDDDTNINYRRTFAYSQAKLFGNKPVFRYRRRGKEGGIIEEEDDDLLQCDFNYDDSTYLNENNNNDNTSNKKFGNTKNSHKNREQQPWSGNLHNLQQLLK